MHNWRSQARCIDLDLQERLLFFGDADLPLTAQAQYKKARMYCYECPVQVQCLIRSVESKERTAVYGGLTESQRRRHAVPHFKQYGMTETTALEIIIVMGQGLNLSEPRTQDTDRDDRVLGRQPSLMPA